MPTPIVACAVWGNWPGSRMGYTKDYQRRGGKAHMQATYITRLRNMVARNLSVKHRFICFADDTDKVPDGIEAWKLNAPWFSRALPKAYVYGAPFTGCPIKENTPILLFDLDTVIIDNIDDLLDHNEPLVVRERGHMLPKLVPDGDIVYSVAGSAKTKQCADIFHAEMESKGVSTNGGDERELLLRSGADVWARVAPGRVVSYKKHCRTPSGPPEGASVVSFHGKPLPDQVVSKWVKEHWR